MQVAPYLCFDGCCEEAFEFYAHALEGTIAFKMTCGESPVGDQMPPEWRDKILHMRLEFGDYALLGSDASPDGYKKPQGMSLSLNISDPDMAARIYVKLVEGGTIQMPLGKTFWARAFATFVDRYGTPWMINCE